METEDVNVMLGRLDERFKNIVQTLQTLQGEIVTKDEAEALGKRVDDLKSKCGSLQTKDAAQAIDKRIGSLETARNAFVGTILLAVLGAVLASIGLK